MIATSESFDALTSADTEEEHNIKESMTCKDNLLNV